MEHIKFRIIQCLMQQIARSVTNATPPTCTLLSAPPWRKHQPDDTGIFPLNEDEKSDIEVCR
jgi:hypothetical protein